MHEQHLAAQLVAQAIELSAGKSMTSLRIVNAVFSGVATESLRLYLEIALEESGLGTVAVELSEEPGRFLCACGHTYETRRFSDPCPVCHGEKRTMISGKECRVIGVGTD